MVFMILILFVVLMLLKIGIIMKTIAVVAIVIVVGVFVGIIATADYGDFVKEREKKIFEISSCDDIKGQVGATIVHRTLL